MASCPCFFCVAEIHTTGIVWAYEQQAVLQQVVWSIPYSIKIRRSAISLTIWGGGKMTAIS